MSPVSLERHGVVSVIRVDNPPVNALSQRVRAGLQRAIDEADADADCKAIVLMCDGRTFIAGADIREFGLPPEPPHLPDLVARIEACDKPVVAAVHGTALGGGFEVALGCHYRIALPSAAVGLPEVKLGLLPGASGTQRLPRLIGVEPALDMMLSGAPVGASEALAAGAIDRIADSDDLRGDAITYATLCIDDGPRRIRDMTVDPVDASVFESRRRAIARRARGLISPQMIVRAVELATEVDFDEGCRAEREFFLECKDSLQSAGLRHAFFAEREAAKVPGVGKRTEQRDLDRVAVIGAGTMGSGIAYSCLSAGMEAVLVDNDEAGLGRGEATIRGLFTGGVERGKVSGEDMADGLSRLSASQEIADVAAADLVIEAVFESIELKQRIFEQLDSLCGQGVVLATNTSTLNIDAIASATRRPADVVGLHFFSPAHVMRLIEIVRGKRTSGEIVATALALSKRLGKIGVVVGNCFGFVGNRMLYGYGRENQLMLLEGAAPETIDRVLYDWGMAMGPNAVGDLAGLDVGYKIRRERTDLPDDPRFYRIADRLVELGRFGQKTGAGMYRYEEASRNPLPDPEVSELIQSEAATLGVEQREISDLEIVERCIYALIVEGARILEEGIATRAGDIDVIWINGYGFPRHRGGPMHFADTIGVDVVYDAVQGFRERFGPMYWDPPDLLKELAKNRGRFADLGN